MKTLFLKYNTVWGDYDIFLQGGTRPVGNACREGVRCILDGLPAGGLVGGQPPALLRLELGEWQPSGTQLELADDEVVVYHGKAIMDITNFFIQSRIGDGCYVVNLDTSSGVGKQSRMTTTLKIKPTTSMPAWHIDNLGRADELLCDMLCKHGPVGEHYAKMFAP